MDRRTSHKSTASWAADGRAAAIGADGGKPRPKQPLVADLTAAESPAGRTEARLVEPKPHGARDVVEPKPETVLVVVVVSVFEETLGSGRSLRKRNPISLAVGYVLYVRPV